MYPLAGLCWRWLARSAAGADFDNFDDNADITSSTLLEKANSPEAWNVYPVSAPLNRYIRIRITGVAANPADTIASAYLIVREGYA